MIGRTNSVLGNTILYSDYFGDGSDGDFVVAAGQTHLEECVADEQQIVKQFKNLTIEAGATFKPANRCNGMIILVQRDLHLDGTISVDKCAPLVNSAEASCAQEPHILLCKGLTGGKGGNAGAGKISTFPNNGVIGAAGVGVAGFALGGSPGAGSGGVGIPSSANAVSAGGNGTRAPIGSTFPYPSTYGCTDYGVGGTTNGDGIMSGDPTLGGGGYGGSGAVYKFSYGDSQFSGQGGVKGNDGDANGGGAVFIYVGGTVYIGETGMISANGGNGASGAVGHYTFANSGYSDNDCLSGGGGGGGGGIVALIHNGRLNNSGTLIARGGFGGAAAAYGSNASTRGSDGEIGEVFIAKLSTLL